jgi:hypothetical protein
MMRFVDQCLITTLLDTFTEFMYETNEKKYLKKEIICYQMRQYFLGGRGDFGGSVRKGIKQNFVLGLMTNVIFPICIHTPNCIYSEIAFLQNSLGFQTSNNLYVICTVYIKFHLFLKKKILGGYSFCGYKNRNLF